MPPIPEAKQTAAQRAAARERAATIAAIAAGRRPARLEADEAVVHDFFIELERTRAVGDTTCACAGPGERGVVDLLGVSRAITRRSRC